jgi:hypothetical protein
LAVLVLAIAGVAYTNISHQPLVGYWEFLVVATGVMCVVTQSPHLWSAPLRVDNFRRRF